MDFICQSDAKLFDFLLILDGHVAFQSDGTSSITNAVENFAFPARWAKIIHAFVTCQLDYTKKTTIISKMV